MNYYAKLDFLRHGNQKTMDSINRVAKSSKFEVQMCCQFFSEEEECLYSIFKLTKKMAG